MQNVNYRDAVQFSLPKGWTAEYLEDGALFREPNGIGVLMLNVVEFECPGPATTEKAVDLLATYGDHEGREILHLQNGNALVTFLESSPGSDAVSSFVWEVVHPVSTDALRMAAFSFVVKRGTENDRQVVDTVSMLTKEIANSIFIEDTVT